jgi:phosphohistidine swiveling domain-containing protein
MLNHFVLHFDSPHISLENAGGKAENLAHLWQAGFNVPQGFIITTEAYWNFVKNNDLKGIIHTETEAIDTEETAQLERASKRIRSAFARGGIAQDLESSTLKAYSRLGGSPVAVRSSATTEDLPDLSFAGQQDTFLNVVGERALLEALIGCWSSLWTARAIGYRMRNEIPHFNAAVGVVIQQMVMSEISGVMFTANPLSGLRSETVIDASFGLGEALVSGQVEPDQYTINTLDGEITRTKPGGGVETVSRQSTDQVLLNETQLKEIAAIGVKIQSVFGTPQDVEWAYAGGELYILQSRPITSLYPLPELSYNPLIVWISFGSVQGLLGPMTPLGRDGVRNVIAGGASLFGIDLKPSEMKVFVSAGERIWIRFSDFIRNPLGYRLFDRLMRFIEPSVVQILGPLMDEQELGAGKGRLRFSTIRRVLSFFGPIVIKAIRNARKPEAARMRFDEHVEAFIATIEAPKSSDRFDHLRVTLDLMRQNIQSVFKFILPEFIPILGPGMASLTLLSKLAGEQTDAALEITRGLPDNVTTQMDLALWEVAVTIKQDDAAQSLFRSQDASSLSENYMAGELPKETTLAIDAFMARYGMRGVGEIDIGRPRWREDPTPVFQTLLSYLRVPSENAPGAVFRRGEQSAKDVLEELAQAVRAERLGWIKEPLVHAAARRARAFLGARETPKFLAIRTMGVIREALLKSGQMFVDSGTIKHPDDLFYLHVSELEAMSRGQDRDWETLIKEHRQRFERENRRNLIPRVLVSDGRAFYEGVGAESDNEKAISGSPVSPGVVEGAVRIVLDPYQAQLDPGDILVCPGTDPAWTPLFLAAAGLVTEVGGMMTHGSVVAREYGIPAVVGVHEATTRLKDGQLIRLNGSTGTITLLDNSP